jgi:hypothetical protein
MSSVCTRE